jgi:hypothetical protein
MTTPVYTPGQVGERLQLSEVTVRRLVRAGYLYRLPGIGPMRIPGWSVEAYIEGRGRARTRDQDQGGDAPQGRLDPPPGPGGRDDGRRPTGLADAAQRPRGGARVGKAHPGKGTRPRSNTAELRQNGPLELLAEAIS